jgi:hypothetical protein
VLVIQTVGEGDHPAVPLLPLAALVATDEQDGDAPRVKGKENTLSSVHPHAPYLNRDKGVLERLPRQHCQAVGDHLQTPCDG